MTAPTPSDSAETTTADPAAQRVDKALIRLAGVILAGTFVAQVDSTVINVSLDTLGRQFGAEVSTIQWVSTGYLLALAMVIPLTGWSIERFGSKRMWLVCQTLFLVGSLLCGLAWSAGSLIAFRVVQGIGGGMILPLAQTILAQAAGPHRMGRLMSAVAVPAMLAPVLGPVIGGLIVTDADWRWIFYINVPVCLVAMLLSRRGIPDTGRQHTQRLDVLGLALLSPGLATLIYGLAQVGRGQGFTDPTVNIPVAAGVALLTAFAVHALRTRNQPIIDLRLLRNRYFAASAGLVVLFGLSIYGAMLLLPLYYQQVRGQSALHAGLLLAPQGLGMMLALVIAGKLTDRTGPRPIVVAGLILAAAGTLAYTQAGPHSNELLLAISLVVRGAGLGAAGVPVLAAAYQGLTRAAIPRATSAIRILQQVGGSFGAAILAVILQHRIAGHLGGSGYSAAGNPEGLAAAFGDTFWWCLAFTALAFVPALLMPRAVIGSRNTAQPAR